ncbi:hypothetical protein [Falsibacillus albus]|uniref:hypothetical protein n=1 Tax=Falsibacillus albus TaxID=2478915 RepID=UPI0022791BAC|nr:hypothetical protein [Falsibacillus albus]
MLFLFWYANKLENKSNNQYEQYDQMNALGDDVTESSIRVLAIGFLILTLAMILMPVFGLSDFSMPLIAVAFFIISFACGIANGNGLSKIGKVFNKGALQLAPSSLLILLAMGIKYIIESSGVMDTILFSVSEHLKGAAPISAGFFMYMFVFLLQFFIPSATAKAFLVMPILTPLGDIIGVTRQSVVLAFNFGDGFSHLLYPTNPALLIALSLAAVNFTKWIKWTILIQAVLFVITLIFLFAAIHFKYGPV